MSTIPAFPRTWSGYKAAYRYLFNLTVRYVPPIDWVMGAYLLPGTSAWRAVRSLTKIPDPAQPRSGHLTGGAPVAATTDAPGHPLRRQGMTSSSITRPQPQAEARG